MTHWTLHKINVFPEANGKKEKKYSNPSEDSVNDGWNKCIMEYTYRFSCFLMISIYLSVIVFKCVYEISFG